MKLVEGQLSMLRMYRDMSTVSDSISSNIFRQYIDMLDKAVSSGFGDIIPRSVDSKPMVGADGKISSKWITPEAGSGRIVSKSS